MWSQDQCGRECKGVCAHRLCKCWDTLTLQPKTIVCYELYYPGPDPNPKAQKRKTLVIARLLIRLAMVDSLPIGSGLAAIALANTDWLIGWLPSSKMSRESPFLTTVLEAVHRHDFSGDLVYIGYCVGSNSFIGTEGDVRVSHMCGRPVCGGIILCVR